jgi:class 3 adenylate cyclase
MLERPDDPGPPDARVNDAERNQVVDLLRQHCGDGYLTLDEFSDRVGQVFEARTRADLELVTMDLPAARRPIPEQGRREARRWAIGIMSGHKSAGRWRPAEEVTALAIMGGVELDLRHAEIDGPEVIITAIAIMGGIDIIVPDNIAVDVSGIPFMGGFDSRVKDVPRLPGQPVIRVKGLALMGGVTVRTKKPRKPVDVGREIGRVGREIGQVSREIGRHAAAGRPVPPPPPMPPIPGRTMPAAPPAPPAASEVASGGWREELKSHAAPDGTVTIMFSDMEGYTEATVRLGDLKARELLNCHNEIVREQLAAYGGYEVKSQGDSFMVAFAGASRALRCAVAIQRAFDDYCGKHPDEPIRVHMGLHTGEVIREQDDFLGRTVILASRIASAASGGEILVSSLLKELTDSTGEFTFGEPREVSLKGLSSPHRLYPVVWDA